jgi:CYTH domain-containing protein
MGREIERKFLVQGDAWRSGPAGHFCRQGFLLNSVECTVRVRVIGGQAYLTIKGRAEGISRPEYEYPIPVADANELLDRLCLPPLIEKTRFIREVNGLKWEIDEFAGLNQGLIVAEIELKSPDQAVALPPWVGLEVTADPRYLNASLVKQPYTTWRDLP